MFYRVWFLYACKVGLLAAVMLITSEFFPRHVWSPWCRQIGLWIVIALGVTGASIGFWLSLVSSKMQCPNCRRIGQFLWAGRNQPAVECAICGLVVPKNIAFSFQVNVLPPATSDGSSQSEDGRGDDVDPN